MIERKLLRCSPCLQFVPVLFLMTALTCSFAQTAPQGNASAQGAPNVSSRRFHQQLPASATSDASTALPKFVVHRDYLAADGPHSVALADLNGDGTVDMADVQVVRARVGTTLP